MTKYLFFSIILYLSIFPCFSQIVSLNNSQEEKDKNLPTSMILKNNLNQNYRNISENPYYNNSIIDELIDEKPLLTYNVEMGIIVPLLKTVILECGLGYIHFGEKNSYSDSNSDSSFHYSNNYRYVGIPLKLKWKPLSISIQKNNSIDFRIGGGFIPQLLFGYSQIYNWTTSFGSQGSNTNRDRTNLNTSTINAILECEIVYSLNTKIAFHLTGNFQKSYVNSFNKYAPYQHFNQAIGIGFGLSKFF